MARGGGITPLYETITLDFEADRAYGSADTGASDAPNANPWTHRRLDVWFDHPLLSRPLRVPGYFAGNGVGFRVGKTWRVHFTPTLPGQWIWFASFEQGDLLNAAPPETSGNRIPMPVDSGMFEVGPVDPAAPGFQSMGAVTWERGSSYFRYSERGQGRFVQAGVGSPENFLGYAGFSGAQDGTSANGQICCCKQNCFDDCRQSTCANAGDGAPNFLHRYAPHVSDWNPGDPDWNANGQAEQGRGIIGALNYLGDVVGANCLYFMVMNLGGDGKDTHPFMTNGGGMDCPSSGSGFSPAHTLNYDVLRMDQWRTVFEHANRKGILLQVMLAEQEACNIRWFGEHDPNGGPRNHMSLYRRLFLKQMVAEFGHLLALRWNLCEENKSVASCSSGPASCGTPATLLTTQFTPQELDEMARWIRAWDVMEHPIGVHTEPNSLDLYGELLALPEDPSWLSATSLQIHGENGRGNEYEGVVQAAQDLFDQAGHRLPIFNDEQGSPSGGLSSDLTSSTSSADDRRRRVLYDVLLSGGQLSYYFGYYTVSNGGGDLRCEDFRTRDQALRQMSFARKVMEFVKIWTLSDMDEILVGPTAEARFDRPEVASSSQGERIVIYYPALKNQPNSPIQMGSLDLRGQSGFTYQLVWLDPKLGVEVGERSELQGGQILPMPIPDLNGDGVPGSSITADTDLLVLLLSRGPTPLTAD
ncbi:DUF5060 domain-containing protein [Saltatorellus ferox]